MNNLVRGLPLSMLALLGGCGTVMQGTAQTINVDVYPRTTSQVTCIAHNERGSYTLSDVPSALQVDRAYGPLNIKCRSLDGWVGDLIVSSKNNELGTIGALATGPVGVIQDIRLGGAFTYPNSVVVRMEPTNPPPIPDAQVAPITRQTPMTHTRPAHTHARHRAHVVTVGVPSK